LGVAARNKEQGVGTRFKKQGSRNKVQETRGRVQGTGDKQQGSGSICIGINFFKEK
jgi:hypothetical protein